MGASWQILPELLGYTNPELVDLFANHPDKKAIKKVREKLVIVPADEIWAVASCGKQSNHSIKILLKWYDRIKSLTSPILRIWQVNRTDNLATEQECRTMSEAIHNIVYHGVNQTKKEQDRLMLSLTGGRKTMSTDLQHAAAWFGCDALIHVVDNPDKSKKADVRNWDIDQFLKPFSDEFADIFTPFCLGSFPKYPFADQVNYLVHDLCFTAGHQPVIYTPSENSPLITQIEKHKAKAGFLLSNYTNKMLRQESINNFLALYTLPEQDILKLKTLKFGIDPSKESYELEILKKLPKAELHCHLGGIANAKELISIAEKAKPDIKKHHQSLKQKIEKWETLIKTNNPNLILKDIISLKNVRKAVKNVPEAICTAAFILLFRNKEKLLNKLMFGKYVSKEKFCNITFKPYEQIGDLQGSAILSHPRCLEQACIVLAEKAVEHNVQYIEVRCSPVKYADPWMDKHEVCKVMADTFSKYNDRLKVALIFTASRHGEPEQIKQHIELAKDIIRHENKETLVPLLGFDLAGDEKSCNAENMQESFLPLMKECMHFTIHAGEDNSADSIWQAVYYLNAERIGHGLSLKDYPALVKKILDRNIALEMCPSSNFQIVGFKDNYIPSSKNTNGVYPLKEYLDQGIKVTVNTDNPGISDTDFSSELHRACRLTPDGLSLWEILSIVRNSFKASFASRHLKHELLKKAEGKIVDLLPELET